MDFPDRITFHNYLEGDIYHLCRADLMPNTLETRRQIASICNQDLVYESLFKEGLKERRYAQLDAEGFLTWAHSGWEDDLHYVFLLVDNSLNIHGCIDIKSSNLLQAEIGYWASDETPGCVTNALVKLCETSSSLDFACLFAYVKPDNKRSISVLLRAGFTKASNLDDRKGYLSYAKKL